MIRAAFLFYLTFLLSSFVKTRNVKTPIFAVWQPCHCVTEFSIVRFSELIFIGNYTPNIKTFSFAVFNRINFGVIDKIFYDGVHRDALMRKNDGLSGIFVGKWKSKILWQRNRQYCGFCSIAKFMSGSLARIHQKRFDFKFQTFLSFLINGDPDSRSDVCTRLQSHSFLERRSAFFRLRHTSFKMFSNIFHRFRGSGGLFYHIFCIDGLPYSGPNGFAQLVSLITKNEQLEKSDYRKHSGKQNQPPVIRCFIFAILGLFIGFRLSFFGWELLYKNRRILGAAILSASWLLGAGGLLLSATGFERTWGWIL